MTSVLLSQAPGGTRPGSKPSHRQHYTPTYALCGATRLQDITRRSCLTRRRRSFAPTPARSNPSASNEDTRTRRRRPRATSCSPSSAIISQRLYPTSIDFPSVLEKHHATQPTIFRLSFGSRSCCNRTEFCIHHPQHYKNILEATKGVVLLHFWGTCATSRPCPCGVIYAALVPAVGLIAAHPIRVFKLSDIS